MAYLLWVVTAVVGAAKEGTEPAPEAEGLQFLGGYPQRGGSRESAALSPLRGFADGAE